MKEKVESKKRGGEGILETKTHVKFVDSEEDESDQEYDDLPEKKDEMNEENQIPSSLAHNSNISDLEYFKSKVKPIEEIEKAVKMEEEEDIEAMHEEDEKEEKKKISTKKFKVEKKSEKSQKGIKSQENASKSKQEINEDEDVGITGRLFIRNLPFSVTEEELITLFKPFGSISEVHVPVNSETKQGTGIAYVLFVIPSHAVKAMTTLDGSIFQGRLIHILPAKAPPKQKSPEPSNGNNSFKSKKESKQKIQQDYNWSSLFMSVSALTFVLIGFFLIDSFLLKRAML